MMAAEAGNIKGAKREKAKRTATARAKGDLREDILERLTFAWIYG